VLPVWPVVRQVLMWHPASLLRDRTCGSQRVWPGPEASAPRSSAVASWQHCTTLIARANATVAVPGGICHNRPDRL